MGNLKRTCAFSAFALFLAVIPAVVPNAYFLDIATKTWINAIVQSIKAVKADQESLRLQNQFFEQSKRPLETPQ